MPKKPTNKRLDQLFEDIQEETARPSDKTKKRPPVHPAVKKSVSPPTRPIGRSLAQTSPLVPAEAISVTQQGRGEGAPSSISLAFQLDNRNWATLQVVDEAAPREWDPNEQLLVRQVVDQLSQALENARLFQETRSRAEELTVLNEMGRELTSLFSVEDIAAAIYKYASRLMDTTNLFVSFYNEKKQEIDPFFVINNHKRIQLPPHKLGQGLSDYILRTRDSLLIPDDVPGHMRALGLETTTLGDSRPAKCWLGTPLLAGDSIIGVIGLQSTETANLFNEHHRDLLTAISGQAAIAIQNARLFEETRKRAEELNALNELNQRLSAKLDVDQVLQEIYRGAERLIDVKNFYIGLYSPEKNVVTFPLNVSESVIDKEIVTIPANSGLTGYVLRTRRPLFIPSNVLEAMRQLGIESVGQPSECWVGVPLLLGEQVIGVMAAQSYTEANAYDEHDRDLLIAISAQASIAIQNARLFTEAERRAYEISTLAEITTTASQSLELKLVLSEVLEKVLATLEFEGGLVTIFNSKRNLLERAVRIGLPGEMPADPAQDLQDSLCEYVYRTGQTLAISDLRQGAPVDVRSTIADGFLGYLGIPLNAKGTTIGTLCVFRKNADLIPESTVILGQSIGNQIGFAIENARLFEETRESQKALARSEGELRALFLAMTDVIIVYDREGRYIRIAPTNPSRLFRPPEDMLGKKLTEVLPESMHQPFLQTIQRALESGQLERTEYSLNIEGKLYWFEANVSRLAEDQVFWVARDITARKQDEEALRRRNEYLSATAEISQLVTSTLDMPTLFSRTVNLVRERFGYYHAGIFVTEETGFNAILQAATGEAGAEMLRQKHSLPVGSRSIVGEVTEKGHAVIVNDTTASQVHRPHPLLPQTQAEASLPLRVGSRTIGALDIQSDHTDAFLDDDIAVLQTLADQVAIAIDNARSYELSMQAVKEMREADRLKSQFLANMSHELRTPLNSIIGFSRVILKGIDGPTTDLQQQDLLAIHNAGQHLLGLINDILDLSRIEAGKMELTFDEVNLSDLIVSVMSTASGLVKDRPITLHRDLPADLPTVRADAMRVRQVLLNLLSNAAKFTDEGSITVSASVSEGSNRHSEIVVRVTDTGPGISAADQKKLFQPFSQVDASPTRKSGGSGLGLSISNHLIQMHGGRMGLDSAPGEGSTFYFTLPIFRGPAEAATPSSKRVILAIDDDPQVISLYERYLQPQGYQVIPLSDPSRAVERVKQLKPFAITLDIMMPGYDGWHVLNDLKANEETRNFPVIVCSILEEREKGFSLGAADYVIKPILEDDLLNALDRLNVDGNLRDILIVDDNPEDLRLLDEMLSQHNRYRPTLARGGEEGWKSVQTNTPHVVIVDLFMPGLDGFTFIEKMRASDKLRDIPVLAVSGGDLTPEQQKVLQEFGQHLIQKSTLTEHQLITILERALQRVHP